MTETPTRSLCSLRRACLVLAVSALSFSGCLKDSGQPCQVNSDCSSGLICRVAPGSERGTCGTMPLDAGAGGAEDDGGEAPLPGDDASTGSPDGG